jgi:pyruvate ferredoxin oxidoreductase beta subunit
MKAGQITWKKNMPAIAAAHDIPYVATACPSYPIDLVQKVKKADAVDGPAYVQILSVCPTGWRSAPDQSIKLGRLAVETGAFPLYEIENGKYHLSIDFPKLRSLKDYIKLQGRFRHLSDTLVEEIEKRIHREYEALREKAGKGA